MLCVNILQIVGHNKGIFLISAVINVQKNWQTNLTQDLNPDKIIPEYSYTISFGYFAGHEKCCQCYNENTSKFDFTLGDCNRSNIESGCKLIQRSEPTIVDMWLGAYSYYSFSDKSYFELLENYTDIGNGTCPEGSTPCGILDTLGHVLCFSNSSLCPVNNFTRNEDLYLIEKGDNDPKRPLIVELNVTDNFPPCLNKEEMNSFKHKNCQIERKSYTNGCQTYIPLDDKNITVDERVYPLETISKHEYYYWCALDSIMSDCVQTEENYEQITTTLYIRNYYGIEKKCLKYYSIESIKNLQMSTVQTSYNSSISSYMIYLVFSIFNCILIIVHWIISLMKNQSLLNKLENQIWSLILLFGFFSSFIIMTFFFETKFFFSLYHEERCFDDINEYIFKNAQSIIQSWKYKDLFLFLSGLIVGISCIIRERLTKDQTFVEYVEYRKPEELEDLEGDEGFTDDSVINN